MLALLKALKLKIEAINQCKFHISIASSSHMNLKWEGVSTMTGRL